MNWYGIYLLSDMSMDTGKIENIPEECPSCGE